MSRDNAYYQFYKNAPIIAGESNEMDKNEDEIHQDKIGHAHRGGYT